MYSPETSRDARFQFGDNWRRFVDVVNEDRIVQAEMSLSEMLGVGTLRGSSFLDVGSGSGLFSLAASRLGASRVHSFDFDPTSVASTLELKHRYGGRGGQWLVEEGDALDQEYFAGLGQFDVVYAWGVLHHTGDMWLGLENVARAVQEGGRLFLAIYNDQGRRSRWWASIKRLFNVLPQRFRVPFAIAISFPRELLSALGHFRPGMLGNYVEEWTSYERNRGMSRWHDTLDWVGGYPFEVARPDKIFNFFAERGFVLQRLMCRERGCNEYVLLKAG